MANLGTREFPHPAVRINLSCRRIQPRRRGMSKADIATLRDWHRGAVHRSLQPAMTWCTSTPDITSVSRNTSCRRRYNHRTDEYGGPLRNRMRLLRELIEDTAEECEGRAAVAVRLCVDEMAGPFGFTRSDIEEVVGGSLNCPTCGTSWSVIGPMIPRRRDSRSRDRTVNTCEASNSSPRNPLSVSVGSPALT